MYAVMRSDPRIRLFGPLLLLAVPAIIAGIGTVRFLVIGTLVLLPVAAAAGTALVDRVHRAHANGSGRWASPRVGVYTSGRFWTDVLAIVAIALVVVAVVIIPNGARAPESKAVEQLPRGCQLWSDPSVAGTSLLIRPDVKVWIDGRADFYGRAHLERYVQILNGDDGLPDGTDCVILRPRSVRSPLAAALDSSPDWSRKAGADGHQVWLRKSD